MAVTLRHTGRGILDHGRDWIIYRQYPNMCRISVEYPLA